MPKPSILAKPLELPSGVVLKNRFFKSAMHEAFGDKQQSPTEKHVKLYRRWGEDGAGVLITGNVMVDRRHRGEPGNVVLEDDRDMVLLKRWSAAGATNGTQFWMQINHPGKQSPKSVNLSPVAPSSMGFGGDLENLFAVPREMTIEEIKETVTCFVATARVAKEAGFTGVQIHAAHGYLVNQFLSPLHNQRTDEYGGSLENRQRFLIEIYKGMRAELGKDFPISVKLNSSDGVSGGFSVEESLKTAQRLSELGMDVIEVSGGTYEAPTMNGDPESREEPKKAVFADFALKLGELIDTPVALTGGFRAKEPMEEAVSAGVTDLVGIARPLVIEPDLPKKILFENFTDTVQVPRVKTGITSVDGSAGAMMGLVWNEKQMNRLAHGKAAKFNRFSGVAAVLHALAQHGPSALEQRRA